MKLIRVKSADAEIGNISVGMATNGRQLGLGEDKSIIYDKKAGNITVNGKMYTFYLTRSHRKTKFGLNGGKILGIRMTEHYKDPNRKDYFTWGYEDKASGVSLSEDFYKKAPKWYVKPSTPEAKAAFEALMKKYN